MFTENLMTITATKANYKDDINKDFKPDDSNADPGVTMRSIIASWKVCGTFHGNRKLQRGAGGVLISQHNKNRCFLVCDWILPFRDCSCEQGEGQRRQAWLFLRIIVMLNPFRFVYSCV